MREDGVIEAKREEGAWKSCWGEPIATSLVSSAF